MHVEPVGTKSMKHNTFNVCMSILLIQGSNYSVYPNSNYSNWEIFRINALNYMKLRIKALYYFKLETLRIRQQLILLQIGGSLN